MPVALTRRASLVAALLCLAAAPAAAQPRALPNGPHPIVWRLTSEPANATITMAQRGTFRIWMEARNVGGRFADTQRDALEWFVNGQPSMQASMAFGNGGRVGEWAALRPGATVREARDMGESLFPAPGEYELAIRREGRVVASLRVRVTAR